MDEIKTRIVTPEQLSEGFQVACRIGRPDTIGQLLYIKEGRYEVIRRLDDGNYLVKEPNSTLFFKR